MNPSVFLSQPEDVKTAYLVVMGAIATADHNNSQAEVDFMQQLAQMAGLSDAAKAQIATALQNPADANLPAHLAKFQGNELKFSLVSDLLNLAYADGQLLAQETTAIQQIATQLGITAEQFDALQKYVQAANAESAKGSGNPYIDANGQPKEPDNSFLEHIGLKGVFEKLGIPTSNFLNGTTVTVALGSLAFLAWQYYNTTSTAPAAGAPATANQPNVMGTVLTGLVSSFIVGGQVQPQAVQPQVGIQGIISGLISSPAGQQAISGVMNNVMSSFAQGKGIGNLTDMIGGGKAAQPVLQNIIGSLFAPQR